MRRIVPDSMAGRFALLLIAALMIVNGTAALLLAREGTQFDHAVRIERDMGRLVALVATLEVVDARTGAGIALQSGTGYSRFAVSPRPIGGDATPTLPALEADIARALPDHPVRVRAGDGAAQDGRPQLLIVSVMLRDGPYMGQWLNSLLYPLPPARAWSRKGGLFILALSMLGSLLVGLGFVWRMTVPLRQLAQAARALDRGGDGPPLPETGPSETRDAAQAFNEMRGRIARFDQDQARMVAAIGHDLRTPITGLRLHAEMIDDPGLREPVIDAIDQMTELAEDLLHYGCALPGNEPLQRIDLSQRLERLARQLDIPARIAPDVACRTRPRTLLRAVGNLLENARIHGGGGRLSLVRDGPALCIRVEDDGPGLPPDRGGGGLEPAPRDAAHRGGDPARTGLGLTIARDFATASGGRLHLANRPEGGLTAEIRLPQA